MTYIYSKWSKSWHSVYGQDARKSILIELAPTVDTELYVTS